MGSGQASGVVEHLRRTVLLRDGAGLTDGQLLGEYVSRRDEAAFAALVRRHGPMVWGVCRRLLGNPHDAEDAFQAAFLVLARKAASIVPRQMVGNWLYGVARQTALKARATSAKRRERERQVRQMPEPLAAEQGLWDDLRPLLDQELSRLPDKYRAAVILCDLEGNTHKEAARRLGVPEGTLSARLARARAMLARRLARRGVAAPGAALAALAPAAAANAPPSVLAATVKATILFTGGQAAGAVPANVAALTEGVLRAMLLSKLFKAGAAALLVAGVLAAAGAVLSASRAGGVDTPAGKPAEGEAVVTATAHEVARTYHANDALGDEKFTGRKVKVTGRVVRVRRAVEGPVGKGSYLLLLETGTAEGKTVPVLLQFGLGRRKELAKLESYQQLTAEGQCEGRVRPAGAEEAILFRDCKILAVEPPERRGGRPPGGGVGEGEEGAPPGGPPGK